MSDQNASAVRDQAPAIAALVLDHRLLGAEEAVEALRVCVDENREPVRYLLEQRLVAEQPLLSAIAAELGTDAVDLSRGDSRYQVARREIEGDDAEHLERLQALPLVNNDGEPAMATTYPLDQDVAQWAEQHYGHPVPVLVASPAQIRTELARLRSASVAHFIEDDGEEGGAGPVPKWVESVLAQALTLRASDIHFESTASGELSLRNRVDGVLQRQPVPPAVADRTSEVMAHIMNRSRMDPTDVFVPQDGSFQIAAAGRTIDVRTSMAPTVTGRKIVLRLLDPSSLHTDLSDIGFNDRIRRFIEQALAERQGTIVTSGPTGSGKTTTLYAMLRQVVSDEVSIHTVEDPVEYRLAGVNQLQVRTGLTDASRDLGFTRALQHILRQDPDIILVGEVRDDESAAMAMQAAMTGHLVLTSLHTTTALQVFTRFTDMDIANYLIADAVSLALSQRLVRTLHDCADWREPTAEERATLTNWGLADLERVRQPVGCSTCLGTGYLGRTGVAEVLRPSDQLRSVIADGQGREAIADALRHSEYVPFSADVAEHLREGHTSLTEVRRVLQGVV